MGGGGINCTHNLRYSGISAFVACQPHIPQPALCLAWELGTNIQDTILVSLDWSALLYIRVSASAFQTIQSFYRCTAMQWLDHYISDLVLAPLKTTHRRGYSSVTNNLKLRYMWQCRPCHMSVTSLFKFCQFLIWYDLLWATGQTRHALRRVWIVHGCLFNILIWQ